MKALMLAAGLAAVLSMAAGAPAGAQPIRMQTRLVRPASAPPPPSPSPGPPVRPAAALKAAHNRFLGPTRPPAPQNLASTVDYPTCSQHGGVGAGLACKALLPQGNIALIWDWPGGSKVDGFRVYRVDGAQHGLVGTQANGKDVTIYVSDTPPDGGFAGKCYAVTSYSGGLESDLSHAVCLGPRAVMQTAVLAPAHWRSVSGTFTATTTSNSGGITVSDAGKTVITEGLVANAHPLVGLLSGPTSIRAQTAYQFDLSPLAGRTIRSARLSMKVGTSVIADDAAPGGARTNHYTSCVHQIASGRDEWWTFNDAIDNAVVLDNIDEEGPQVSYDVTGMVRGWVQYADPNYGFVLINEDSDPACQTQFVDDTARLTVEYY